MNTDYATFVRNAQALEERIARICADCGRDPLEVQLMAVTKTHGAEAVDYAARYGLKSIGENRVQEAATKKPESTATIRWELIGHLQSNKAKLAVEIFDRIQSVDRAKLVRALDRHAGEQNRVLPVLLQVNAGDDPAKFGVSCEDAPALLEAALEASHLKVEGLMTIAPLDEDPTVARSAFERLRNLRDELQEGFGVSLPELSMGMTDDLEQAVRAGSTCVRVGTALFGARE